MSTWIGNLKHRLLQMIAPELAHVVPAHAVTTTDQLTCPDYMGRPTRARLAVPTRSTLTAGRPTVGGRRSNNDPLRLAVASFGAHAGVR